MNTTLQKTEKIPGRPYRYRRLGCSLSRKRRVGNFYFALVEYKGKPRVVVTEHSECREFHSNQIMSPSEARLLIGWLAGYIAQSDPDPISLSIASTRVHAKLIRTEQDKIAASLGLGNEAQAK